MAIELKKNVRLTVLPTKKYIEGHGDDVGAGADSPTQIGFILLGQSRQGHRNTRQVDALVAGNRPGNDDLGVHVVAFDLGDLNSIIVAVTNALLAGLNRLIIIFLATLS